MTLFKARHKHSVTYNNIASLRMTNQIIFTLKSNVVNEFNISMQSLKDWSRSTMNEDRLTGLALLDKDIDKVNIVDLIAQDIE